MSDKHFLPSDTGKLVPNCLRAITYEYEFLSLLDKEKSFTTMNLIDQKLL